MNRIYLKLDSPMMILQIKMRWRTK